MTEARAQLGAANFDWGMIGPVLARMVEHVGRINGAVRRRGSAIAPVRGRDDLRNWVYLSVRDSLAIGNQVGVVTWRVVMNRVLGRLIHHGVTQQGNAVQRDELVWEFHLLCTTVRRRGDIRAIGDTVATHFVDSLYDLFDPNV